MKRHILTTMLLLAAMTGCRRDDTDAPDDLPSGHGAGVSFLCKDAAGGIPGIIVEISPLGSGCSSGSYTRSADTDSSGRVKFTSLDPQEFCYRCTRVSPTGVQSYRTGGFWVYEDSISKVVVAY